MLNELAKEIYEGNKKRGFWDEDDPANHVGVKLMLIVTELAEAMEADRKDKYGTLSDIDKAEILDEPSNNVFNTDFEGFIKDTFQDELADTLIRLLDLCGKLDINIDLHLAAKMRYNSLRSYKHGKKY